MRGTLSIALVAALSTTAWAAGSFDEAFKNGKAGGNIRLAHIHQSNDATGADTTYATAIGGILKYETLNYQGLQLAAAAYISQNIHALSGDHDEGERNPDFFDDERKSFIYIGEAYANYRQEDVTVRIGRQQLDTPLANTDDIRMHPNTFEAAVAVYEGFEDTVVTAGFIGRWAGFDSGDDISEFKNASGEGGRGTAVLGVGNTSVEDLAVQGWYYESDDLLRALYADAAYTVALNEELELEAGVQAANFWEKASSGIAGTVAGLSLSLGINPVTLFAAYNRAFNDDGETVVNGFGGGPYFTSMAEMTIDGLNDAEALMVGAEMEFSDLGAKGLRAAYAYGTLEGNIPEAEYEEHDFVVTYAYGELLDVELLFADVKDKTNPAATSEGYSLLLTRVNYYF